MGFAFDAVVDDLLAAEAADRVSFLAARVGLPPAPAHVLDVDLTAKAFFLPGPPAAILHIDRTADSRPGVLARLLRDNVLLSYKRAEPVYSVLVLLRPEADSPDITGTYARRRHDGAAYVEFRYEVVRLWREPVDALLAGAPGLAPLALATDESVADLPGTVARFAARLRRPDVRLGSVGGLVASAVGLAALRHDRGKADGLLREAPIPEAAESVPRHMIWLLGRKRFGPSPAADDALATITDAARLERLVVRVLDAAGWDDLLATP